MSSLVNLMGFAKDTKGGREEWAFSNADDHTFIRDEMQRQSLGNLIQYPLYPLNWKLLDKYEFAHQTAHDEINNALGLPGTDLTGVDFEDAKKAQEWHLAHYREHDAWHAALGV